MKRTALIRHLTANGCELKREGSRHSLWVNPVTSKAEAVPRHPEIGNIIARSICHALGIPDPPG
ncbi:MAG: type II toxin-antitoxin system HicA family toxin [Tepidiformaceae bacterium]